MNEGNNRNRKLKITLELLNLILKRKDGLLMKKIFFVTGATGFVGSNLVQKLYVENRKALFFYWDKRHPQKIG